MHRLDAWWQDARRGARGLARTPGFTLAAVVTLALGIGANAAIFTVVNAVLLKPLPYSHPERRVMIWSRWVSFDKTWLADGEVLDYRRRCRTLASVAAWDTGRANLTGAGNPLRVSVGAVTANTFSTLGAEPLLGRGFTEDEDRPGGEPVVVLGYGLWQQRFGGDRGHLGRAIEVDGVSRRVVGVMPAGFRLPTDYDIDRAEPTALWVPLQIDPATADHGSHGLYGAAELAPGATAADATAELKTVTANMTREGLYPAAMQFSAFAVPVEDGDRRRRAPCAAAALRRGRLPAAHRVRERREPAARARRGPASRDGDPLGARREPRRASCGSCSPRGCCSPRSAARPASASRGRASARWPPPIRPGCRAWRPSPSTSGSCCSRRSCRWRRPPSSASSRRSAPRAST